MLLVGATTVQVVSALYQDGFPVITGMIKNLEKWMEANDYASIDDFKGKLSMDNSTNLAEYERVQFMRHFGEYK